MILKQKILKAIENNKLKLIEWKRNWYNYIISVQSLVWERNLFNWYNIDIFNNDWLFLESIKINSDLENYYYKKLTK